MVRKTRRRGAGKGSETRHSPLARKLLVHRAYENVAIPALKKDFAAAQALDADLENRVRTTPDPAVRAALREIQVRHAKEVLAGVKTTTDAAEAAKAALRKEFNAKGGTRRKLRGGQDKFSPMARLLAKHRVQQNYAIPALAKKLAEAQEFNADLGRRAAAMRTPEGREEMRQIQIDHRNEIIAEANKITDKADATREALRSEFNAGGRRRKTRRRHRKW
jgi:hypothetical protein